MCPAPGEGGVGVERAPKEEDWLGPGTESFPGGVSWGDEQKGCCHLSLSLCWGCGRRWDVG